MSQKRCKACGRRKPPLAVQHGDEFCSTDCAKRHYGTVHERRAGRPARSSRVARVSAMGKAS